MRINDPSSSIPNLAGQSTQARLKASLQKLSTGLRINRASDDAAGLSVSESLRSQIRGGQTAENNTGDALSMLRIAEGGGQQITETLQRMRELALQASNGTYSAKDRSAMQSEYAALASEISDVAAGTTYNGIPLLNAKTPATFQIGTDGTKTGKLDVRTGTGLDPSALGDLSSAGSARGAVKSIDGALSQILSNRSGIGAAMNRLTSASDQLAGFDAATSAAESQIRDTDYAQEAMALASAKILDQAALAMSAQSNMLPANILNLLR